MSWWKSLTLKSGRYPKEIRHSLDENEFRRLVAGQVVELQLDKRIFPDGPRVKIALLDIGWYRVTAAVVDAMDRSKKENAR